MQTWQEAHQRGVSFYVTPQGALRMKNAGLTASELAALRSHRAAVVAGWLWTVTEPPDPLDWDTAVVEAMMAQAVSWVAGPAFPPEADWTAVDRAEEALDQAWSRRSLPQWVRAVQAWVVAVSQLWPIPGADETASDGTERAVV